MLDGMFHEPESSLFKQYYRIDPINLGDVSKVSDLMK